MVKLNHDRAGVLLWELWEKKEPFEGEDELTVAFKVAQDKQTLPISPSVPEVRHLDVRFPLPEPALLISPLSAGYRQTDPELLERAS